MQAYAACFFFSCRNFLQCFVHPSGWLSETPSHAEVERRKVIDALEAEVIAWRAGIGYWGPGDLRFSMGELRKVACHFRCMLSVSLRPKLQGFVRHVMAGKSGSGNWRFLDIQLGCQLGSLVGSLHAHSREMPLFWPLPGMDWSWAERAEGTERSS